MANEQSQNKTTEKPLVLHKVVPLSSLTLDRGLWCRVGYTEKVIEKYRWKYEIGVEFPPLTVYQCEDVLWLVDGWHRYQAAMRAGILYLPVIIHIGTRRDALRFSLSANAEHDSKQIREEKKENALWLMKGARTSNFSTQEIADMVGLSISTIGRLRRQFSSTNQSTENSATLQQQNGSPHPTKTELYDLVYGDLPWCYEKGYEDPSETRPTLTQEELCELNVSALCAPNAILFLHVSAPKMGEAVKLVDKWRFTYQTTFTWGNEKDFPNIDPWTTCTHEFFVIATRGNMPDFELDQLTPQRSAEATPTMARAVARQFLENHYPYLKKAELLPKEKKPGWNAISLESLRPKRSK